MLEFIEYTLQQIDSLADTDSIWIYNRDDQIKEQWMTGNLKELAADYRQLRDDATGVTEAITNRAEQLKLDRQA